MDFIGCLWGTHTMWNSSIIITNVSLLNLFFTAREDLKMLELECVLDVNGNLYQIRRLL